MGTCTLRYRIQTAKLSCIDYLENRLCFYSYN